MRYLSFIMAIMVLVLSASSCFIEDKCLEQTCMSTEDQHQNDDDCGMSCCSPFSKCNTCTGFVVTSFCFSLVSPGKLQIIKLGSLSAPTILDFPYSTWHPPQLA